MSVTIVGRTIQVVILRENVRAVWIEWSARFEEPTGSDGFQVEPISAS